RKDGTKFWMEWSIVPLKNKQGGAYQYLAIQKDVSARIEADRKLRQARQAEREAQRARSNLARYFSPSIVETLAAKDQPLGPVRRQNLSVLFADIKGFTRISETIEPEQVIELLRDVHSWMEKIIFKWQGSIQGYIGDAVLAIFGYPIADEKAARNTLFCAQELLEGNRKWNEQRIRNGQIPLHIGIGSQYGPVVLGDVGTEDYVEFTVIGDTVNSASRLQQASRSLNCNVVVGNGLVEQIKAECDSNEWSSLSDQLSHHGDLPIRGRSQSVDIWTMNRPT
ncbi:MAG: adenylate/guanylate cyclase domain-containing protein, partial [Desulfobulbia bacterium]